MNYKTSGVCSSQITFDVKDNKVVNVHFIGGCMQATHRVSPNSWREWISMTPFPVWKASAAA